MFPPGLLMSCPQVYVPAGEKGEGRAGTISGKQKPSGILSRFLSTSLTRTEVCMSSCSYREVWEGENVSLQPRKMLDSVSKDKDASVSAKIP